MEQNQEEILDGILKGLNSDQRAAVLHDHETDNQLLILAGAGSGKTSVLTKRIQYRIAKGADPTSILALTFTAAAAAEMRERVEKLFPNAGVKLSTFHSLALSILRDKFEGRHGYEILGFKKPPMPKEVLGNDFLCELADAGVSPGAFSREDLFSDKLPKHIAKKTETSRQRVLDSGEVVFEDLIYLAIRLIETDTLVRSIIQNRYREIMVDEYQDINPTQYRLVRAILGSSKSLFAVGDDDQAIYGFRGADIGNIFRFQKDFPSCKLIRLEWNYRSVPEVLHLANRIFKDKPVALRKVLRAGNNRQDDIFRENRKTEIWISRDPVEEIQKIVMTIREMRELYGLPLKGFAVLVRYNRQREYYEQALRACGIMAGEIQEDEVGGNLEEIANRDAVHVVTVHGSKGLQYPVVFYAGMAEGLTPGECKGNRKQRKAQLAEERRLFYVGVTRAESVLYLLYCKKRFWKGKETRFKPSRFLRCVEIPSEGLSLPVFVFKIKCVIQALAYMASAIVEFALVGIFKPKTVDARFEKRIQEFSQFCMRILRINLTVENQALLAKVDWSRPVVVVSNHQSYADIPVIFIALERSIGFLAKYELTRIPFLNYWMKRIGCVFVKRDTKGGGAAAQEQLLNSKTPRINVFPEGTREKQGKLMPFKSGGFRLAADWKATMLPVVIHGTRDAWESRKHSKLVNVTISILEPMDLTKVEAEKGSVEIRSYLIPEIRNRMEAKF